MKRASMAVFLGLLLIGDCSDAAEPRFEFTRMVAHWAQYGGDDFLPFIRDARPEVVQHGFYGAHFWSLVHTPQYAGYPSHFPVRGIDECGTWFRERNAALHKLDAKVVGHFNVEFLVGEPDGKDGPRGFFHFYNNLWDEKKLGPKPVADPMDFLEKGPDGKPIINNSYSIGGMREYWACLRNPNWQKVLKAWVKHGIDQGLDGFIANYFYRHNCLCEHCQEGFRDYLAERFSQDELKKQFDISRLRQHKFNEIVFWHNPAESTPLKREMLRWSQLSNKEVFDEVFIRYGRSLKPELLAAQWNHLGNFGQINGDERCLLPADVWGKDEDYLWYSTGGAAYFTDLEKRFLGEGTLQARYIRGTFEDKPFTLGKYENTRIRVAISELAANGGAPMGFYTRFTDPAARKEIVRYYQFIKRYEELYKGNRSHAEAVLLFPRKSVHAGKVEPVGTFREVGTRLLDEHVLFDILPDDLATRERLSGYAHVVHYDGSGLSDALNDSKRSRINAPYTVRVSASQSESANEISLHFVNYNRTEPPKGANGKPSAGRGIVDEKPIEVRDVTVDFAIPQDARVVSVETMTPESPNVAALEHSTSGGRLKVQLPAFLVYRVVRIRLE